MAAVTQIRGSGYASFPRTSPHRSWSHESSAASPHPSSSPRSSSRPRPPPPPTQSPWFSCRGAPTSTPTPTLPRHPDPETDHHHLPSPEEKEGRRKHATADGHDDLGLEVTMAPPSFQRRQESMLRYEARRQRQQQQQNRRRADHSTQQQQQQHGRPGYPTTIEFELSDVEFVPTDEEEDYGYDDDDDFGEPVRASGLLGRPTIPTNNAASISLEETFGFDRDAEFERLYAEEQTDEDAGTLQSSSVDLNPYGPARPQFAAEREAKQTAQRQRQRGSRESIFRPTRRDGPSPRPAPAPAASAASRERKIDDGGMRVLVSPTAAMDSRRSSSRPKIARGARSEAVATPTSSIFTAADPVLRSAGTGSSLRRDGSGSASLHRDDTGASSSAPRSSRNRSSSRGHRGSWGGGGRRSRSRSTSVAAPSGADVDHHRSVFRGAALIREQLLRSMASADQAVDEAERELHEGVMERRGRLRRGARHDGRGDDAAIGGIGGGREIDFDYSFDRRETHGGGDAHDGVPSSPSKAMSHVRFSPSQDSSALETEGRRLDNLMSIFAANSSLSSNAGPVVSRSPLGWEDAGRVGARSDDADLSGMARMIAVHGAISPTSTLGPNSPAAHPSPPARDAEPREDHRAGGQLQEDAQKPAAVVSPTTGPRTSASPVDDVPERSAGTADEALEHARRAGPLWRSLVGCHVRFPSRWDSALPPTSPPVHPGLDMKWSRWYYVARHRVRGDRRLNSREFGVRSRRSGGRLLLRIVIREARRQQACREVAIGCFHPNCRGIRKGDPLPEAEDVREVWMAVRWLMGADADEPTLDLREEGEYYEGVVDSFLIQKRNALDYDKMGSTLGHRKAVNNENVRAIFGDQPPLTMVDLHEDEIAEILKSNGTKNKLAVLPALMLLKLFLFSE